MPDQSLIVIGGGAAGFFGAIAAAEQGVKDILILEKTRDVLTKVRISGGGRCNVTHDCPAPRDLVKNYPRGHRSLHGPFSRFNATDTIAWFDEHGVSLKTEPDGRMFPATNTSETIVQCLCHTARELGIQWQTRTGVTGLEKFEKHFAVHLADGQIITARRVLVATGGLRSREAQLAVQEAEHEFTKPVPSLFTFHIDDARLAGLSGTSSPLATAKAGGHTTSGPILITHWGLSGPAILKLSAWAARELAEKDYQFTVTVNWTGQMNPEEARQILLKERENHPTRQILKRSLFNDLPQRLWARLCLAAGIAEQETWANLKKNHLHGLTSQLTACQFQVTGKSTNKDEFVTCGGVQLKDLNLKTMESKSNPGLHFAGEVLDVDGITGGFNFQAAWTTGYLAGSSIATSLSPA
ncbi:MAG: NAD(P)/FAD-dependent oxidoreductase [Verrucomicrobiota bacterium JB023]|nr:NAD(P)/FAD-dependent oxidoreductase [Verrucomicrobiota bacterium JB023]